MADKRKGRPKLQLVIVLTSIAAAWHAGCKCEDIRRLDKNMLLSQERSLHRIELPDNQGKVRYLHLDLKVTTSTRVEECPMAVYSSSLPISVTDVELGQIEAGRFPDVLGDGATLVDGYTGDTLDGSLKYHGGIPGFVVRNGSPEAYVGYLTIVVCRNSFAQDSVHVATYWFSCDVELDVPEGGVDVTEIEIPIGDEARAG